MFFGIPLSFDSIMLVVLWLQRHHHHLNNNLSSSPLCLLSSSSWEVNDKQLSSLGNKSKRLVASARQKRRKGKGSRNSRSRSNIISRGGWTTTTMSEGGGGLRVLPMDPRLRAVKNDEKDSTDHHHDDESSGSRTLLQQSNKNKKNDDSHHDHDHHGGTQLPGWFDRFTIDPLSSTISLFGKQQNHHHHQEESQQQTKPKPSTISLSLLCKQNAETSNALIEYCSNNDSKLFDLLANYEGRLTIERDNEDSQKLQSGIDYAISKGVIIENSSNNEEESSSSSNNNNNYYCEIDVLGKTPDEVATEILQKVLQEQNTEDDDDEGCVIVICGLSGTGKGTTVAKICQQLQEREDNKQVLNWSNGNIFRSITLLAVTWYQQQQLDHCSISRTFDKEKALTPNNLKSFFGMLHFGYYNNKYDILIDDGGDLGINNTLVSVAQNTILKSPEVAKNIPTVAEMIQGEVINFASEAIETLRKDGYYVLVEGRKQTMNFIPTPHRFTLVLSDQSLIGKRRAAQRLMATALSKLQQQGQDDEVDDDDEMMMIDRVLQESLEELTKDLPSSSPPQVVPK